MQNTSALYKQIISETNHWFEVSVTIGGGGVLIDEYKDWIDFGALYLAGSLIDTKTAILVESGGADDGIRENSLMSVSTSNQLFDGNTPSVGNAVSGQIELKLIDLGFSIPRMAEIRPYVRVTNGTDTSEWIPQGVFYTDTRYITHNDDGLDIWTITGFDAMLKAEQPFPYDTKRRVRTVVNDISGLMGLAENVDPHVWEVISASDNPLIQCSGEYTAREHLQYIAALYGGNWTITNEGKLNLVRINDAPYETNLLTDESGYTLNFAASSTDDTPSAERIVVGS